MSHIRNAVIESADITTSDHGCLVIWLHLDYGGAGQGFGGYALGRDDDPQKIVAYPANIGSAFIVGCLRAAGVSEWSRLPGKAIRVRLTDDSFLASIEAIGHIIRDDAWFDPKAMFAATQKGGVA